MERELAAALDPVVCLTPSRRRLAGEQEARLLAVAYSPPPDGSTRWTLRLLVDKIAGLKGVGFLRLHCGFCPGCKSTTGRARAKQRKLYQSFPG